MLSHSYCIIILFLLLHLTYQRNMPNSIDVTDENHKTVKFIALLLFIIFILYGIISNTLMAIVLFCKEQSKHYSREFILITSQLIISDLITFLPQMVVVLPEILTAKNSSYANETTWINYSFSTFNTFSLFSILHFSFLLTVNRFVALILPKHYFFFESTKLYFMIAFVWLSVLAITLADFYYCTRRFLVWSLSWGGDCVKSGEMGDIWWRVRYIWALCVPNIMFIMYIAIFHSIRRKRNFTINSNQRITITCARHERNAVKIRHYERSMLVQAAWHCGVLEVGIIIFNFLPPILIKFFNQEVYLASRIFLNCFILFSCALLPTVHFTYSKQSRNIIKHHLYDWIQFRIGRLRNTATIQGGTQAAVW
uniref:G_PROTEIN_RECEP_F1_2 domain-containing protein n=1 Tax=Wuchereria bancrofti TaxID=6293 RepID=A0A1I8F0R2_WUCBA